MSDWKIPDFPESYAPTPDGMTRHFDGLRCPLCARPILSCQVVVKLENTDAIHNFFVPAIGYAHKICADALK